MPRAIGTTYEPDGKFLFPVKPLSKVFRAKYLAELSKKLEIDKATKESLFKKSWIVYAKRPFGSAKSVVEYLGRYTHKVAISNHRIQHLLRRCRCCGEGNLVTIEVLEPRGPPASYMGVGQTQSTRPVSVGYFVH